MKLLRPFVLIAVLVVVGCGSARPVTVPNVAGQRLDVAETNLDAVGLDHRIVGGGVVGVILHSRWQVCAQAPRPGLKAVEVTLIVSRVCAVPPTATGKRVVPDVRGESLDAAEAQLGLEGIGYRVQASDEIIVRSHWIVCEQDPGPDTRSRTVELYVSRDCDSQDW